MAKTIYVYENWSSETPIKLGMLYVDQGRGSEHYAFEYDETWLTTNRFAYVLDPDLALNVSEDDSAISFDLAIETAQYYGITQTEAEKIVEEISTTVRDNWERLASEYGLSRGSIEKMRPAFSACYE